MKVVEILIPLPGEVLLTIWCKTSFIFLPSVTTLGMESCVTGFAQCDEVIFTMCPTFGKRNPVMNLLSRDQESILLAQFTQRMSRRIPVTDSFPRSAVSSAYSGIAVVFFVAFCLLSGVFFTEPTVSQPGTSGMGTGTLGFRGHCFSFGKDKSHRRITPVMAFVVFFGIISIPQVKCAILCQTVPTFNSEQKNLQEPSRVCGVRFAGRHKAFCQSPPN